MNQGNDLIERIRKALPASRLGVSADYDRKLYHCVVDNAVRLEDLKRPGFWMNVCGTNPRLSVGSLIDVVREDMSLDVTLRVIKVGPGLAHVRVRGTPYVDDSGLEKLNATAEDAADPTLAYNSTLYKVAHLPKGADAGYYALHRETQTYIRKGLPSMAAAAAVARQHEQEAGAVAA